MKKLLKISYVLAIIIGIIMLSGGILGIVFTYNNIVREKITTPEDASIPSTLVRGPLTLKAQADIIRVHTLKTTDGQTYSEMLRQIPILDKNGKTILVSNSARDMWITATTLTTALNLGIIAYAFSSLVLLLGLMLIWIGIVSYVLSKKY